MRNINLVYICDEKSIKKCCVSMISALKNKDSLDYIHFYFVIDEIFSKRQFSEFDIFNTNESSIHILNVESKKFHLYRETTQRKELPVNAYYRLEIPWLLPEEEKAIYIDYDTIILKSLWNLYNSNIEEYYLAAVEDAWKYKRARELYKYQPKMRHYNSGMMLMNLKKWRNENINKKFECFARQNKKVFILADQFLINTILNQNIFYLDFIWNLQIPRTERNEPLEYDDLVAFEKAKRDPVIIHYNFQKPWNFLSCTNPYFDLWWKYAKELPFYEELLLTSIKSTIAQSL